MTNGPRNPGRRWPLAAWCVGLLVLGCGGTTPVVTAPVATPTTEPAPTASPGVSAADWATEFCDVNAAFQEASQSIATDFPTPAEATLVSLQAVHAQRAPVMTAANTAALEGARAMPALATAAALRDAFVAEMEARAGISDNFYAAVAAATSIEAVRQAETDSGTAGTPLLTATARSIHEIDVALSDAIAGIETGCRFFEFDARARVHDRASLNFARTIIDDELDAPGPWALGAFEGGSVSQADGKLTIAFTANGGTHAVSTDGLDPPNYGDVRIETTYSAESYALSGLACRIDGETRYTVQVNPLGLILIYAWGDRQELIGRRAAPEDRVADAPVTLALECVGGQAGEPVLLIVYLDGVRQAEVLDSSPLVVERGAAGLFAQTLGLPSKTVFENVVVLVPEG